MSTARPFVEVEQQGRLCRDRAGRYDELRVRWLLRKLPAGVARSRGNAALLQFGAIWWPR